MMHSVGIVSQFTYWTLDEIENTYFQRDLREMKKHVSEGENIFRLKSWIKGHRNGYLAEMARSRPNGLGCLAGHFYGL